MKTISGCLKMTVLKCEVVTLVKLNCNLHSYDTVWCWGCLHCFVMKMENSMLLLSAGSYPWSYTVLLYFV